MWVGKEDENPDDEELDVPDELINKWRLVGLMRVDSEFCLCIMVMLIVFVLGVVCMQQSESSSNPEQVFDRGAGTLSASAS